MPPSSATSVTTSVANPGLPNYITTLVTAQENHRSRLLILNTSVFSDFIHHLGNRINNDLRFMPGDIVVRVFGGQEYALR
jgi:hypothetical protein